MEKMQRLLLVDQKKELLKAKHANYIGKPTDSTHSLVGTLPRPGNLQTLASIVIFEPMSVLLLCWPLGMASHLLGWNDVCTFWLSFLSMIPLAKILGDATEELAAGLKNDTVGGLLNATFGNAVEMILTIQTLRAGELDVVKGSLLGSILSNLLLVLGMSFFVGGLTRFEGKVKGKEQAFSKEAALTNMTMLLLATSAFALPTVFFTTRKEEVYSHQDPEDRINMDEFVAGSTSVVLQISRFCSIYILCAYIAFLVFQLYTHVDVFQSDDGNGGDDEESHLTVPVALALLFITTCFTAVASEWLVDSIDGVVANWHLGKEFIGVILLPIVGNACEHAGAVRMAMQEKVDITIGIAVGSCTQIALFVVPFSVLVGWLVDRPMDLNFGSMNLTVLVFAVLVSFSIITDGASNWLEGFMLMVAYAVVATLFWFSA